MGKILITGTTSGIGNYLGENLKYNNTIIGIGRKENNIGGIEFLNGDLRDFNFIENISQKIEEIDYLIINAGIGYFDSFENIKIDEHKEIIETNLLFPIILIHYLFKKIKKGIIIIGSISSKKSGKYGASYSATKFGIRGFAMNLKNELKGKTIQIINPRVVKTNFHKNSQIQIQGIYEETKIEDIYKTVKEIIEGKEKRFEIDL